MRRLGRWLLNIAAGVSLALCALNIFLWVRSYQYDQTLWLAGQCNYKIQSDRGAVTVFEKKMWYFDRGQWKLFPLQMTWNTYLAQSTQAGTVQPNMRWFDFQRRTWQGPGGWRTTHTHLTVPYWFVLILSLALPGIRLAIRRSARPGSCASCGYDLTGTLQAGRARCPECGKPVENPSTGPSTGHPMGT